jgi:hypothetical protein
VADLTALQVQHPEWNLVDAMDAPNGGTWALGADGGVFALDGAPFFGSYWNIAPEGRQGTRSFRRIEFNPASGGYSLISDRGERYEAQFGDPNYKPPGSTPDTATTPPPAVVPPPPAVDANQVTLTGLLKTMGLDTIVDKAWAFWTDMGATATTAAINIWIRDQPEFIAKFPAMKDLEAKGIYWSPADYMKYTQGVNEVMSRTGAPKELWDDPEDYAKLLRNGWSLDEVVDAATQAENAVLNLPPEVKAQARAWNLNDGDLLAIWLNPDKGLTLAQRKATEGQLQIGAGVTSAGLGGITQAQAEAMRLNVGVEGVTRGLETYAGQGALLAETAGETMAGEELGAGDVISAVGGTTAERAASGRKIERRRESRKAAFGGGGGAAGGGQGTTGLGSSR